MIGQCLSNKNEIDIVPKTKKIGTKQGLSSYIVNNGSWMSLISFDHPCSSVISIFSQLSIPTGHSSICGAAALS